MARPTIELSMIVRNGDASLDRCLASAAPLVDRIVVGDTGSADDTVSIAKRYGAEVFSIPWEDDFSRARNRVLAKAKCDWILVLDADEMLEADGTASLLPQLLEDATVHAYTFPRWDYVGKTHGELVARDAQPNAGKLPQARAYPAYVRSFHTRLFRRHREVFYTGCVHEQVTDRLNLLGLNRIGTPIVIHHFGQVETPAEQLEEKIRLYHRLGLQKAASDPRNFDAHLQLGIAELFQMNCPEGALEHLRNASAIAPGDGRVWLYQGVCLLRLGRLEEAQRSLLQARAFGEHSLMLYDALGDSYLRAGAYDKALAAYRAMHRFGSVSPIAEAKAGAAEVNLGLADAGLARIRSAIRRDPESAALRSLLDLCSAQIEPNDGTGVTAR